MYDKLWNFHVTFNENYEFSMERKMWIVLDSLPDSWDYEKKALTERMSKLSYENTVAKLNKQLECRIQSGIRRSSKLKNVFLWMKKMYGTLTRREFARREHEGHQRNELYIYIYIYIYTGMFNFSLLMTS